MIVLHDDGKREYAYGPAQGLPATRVGAFTQALYDEAKKQGWVVISMKNDWKRVFAFENNPYTSSKSKETIRAQVVDSRRRAARPGGLWL